MPGIAVASTFDNSYKSNQTHFFLHSFIKQILSALIVQFLCSDKQECKADENLNMS